MEPVQEDEVRSGQLLRPPAWPTAVMLAWLLGLVVTWGIGLSYVPFTARCDYSKQTSSIEVQPDPGAPHDAVVEHWSGQVETTWAPPGFHCGRGGPLAEDQKKLGGPKQDAWAIQALLIVTPLVAWWAAARGGASVACRRRIAFFLLLGGLWLLAIGVWSVLIGSSGLGFASTLIAVGLLGVGLAYRHRTPAASALTARSC